MAVCRYHPDRLGVGICMRCRAVICADCSTRVDGINHCHACLNKLAQHQPGPARDMVQPVLALMILGISSLILFGLAWLVQFKLAS